MRIKKNRREHNGLGFEDAQYVFADPQRIERLDWSESNKPGGRSLIFWLRLAIFTPLSGTVYTNT